MVSRCGPIGARLIAPSLVPAPLVAQLVTQTQRFFFGHNNDIYCIAQHPCKWIVATGQQVQTGPDEMPYLCVWETRGCRMLQRIDHPKEFRGIIALGFSPNGQKLAAITCDNNHSLFIWDWMTNQTKLMWLSGLSVEPIPDWPTVVPGYKFGPIKNMTDLHSSDSGAGGHISFALRSAPVLRRLDMLDMSAPHASPVTSVTPVLPPPRVPFATDFTRTHIFPAAISLSRILLQEEVRLREAVRHDYC